MRKLEIKLEQALENVVGNIIPEPASKSALKQFEEELKIMVDSYDYRNITLEEALAIADKVITKVWKKNE